MNPTAACTGNRGYALGVARIGAWTLIAASAITLAGCGLIVALIMPEEIHLGPEFGRALAESMLLCWLVDLILLLLL